MRALLGMRILSDSVSCRAADLAATLASQIGDREKPRAMGQRVGQVRLGVDLRRTVGVAGQAIWARQCQGLRADPRCPVTVHWPRPKCPAGGDSFVSRAPAEPTGQRASSAAWGAEPASGVVSTYLNSATRSTNFQPSGVRW